MLADLDAAVARVRRADEVSRPLRIAYAPSAGYETLPLILAELEADGVAAAVRAERLPAPKVLEAVAAGEAELGHVGSGEPRPGLVELAAPESRESLVDHLSRHPDHAFIGPVSMASADWGGVIRVRIDDPRARLGLRAVWSAADGTRAAPLLATARAVSDRQGWLAGP